MTDSNQLPSAPGPVPPAPPSSSPDDATQPVSTSGWAPAPRFAPPATGTPTFAPPEAWSPPAAQPTAPAWTPVATAKPATASRGSGVGPRFLLAAMLGTAVLASGGTYLAVSASHETDANQAAATLPTTNGTNSSNGNGSTGGSAQAPGAVPPTTQPVPSTNPAPATGQGGSLVDVVKQVSPAVVTITAEGVTATDPTTGQTGQGTAVGSGVIFDALKAKDYSAQQLQRYEQCVNESWIIPELRKVRNFHAGFGASSSPAQKRWVPFVA